MAVDTQKLFYLLDPVFQIENLAGKPVVGGHIEVFVAGTDTKYITWQDWGGARNPFKIPLKSDGRAVILVEPQYTYDVYVYDSFNNMVCSRLNVSPAIGGDVSVSGLTQVYHDETISGNGTPYEPLGIVSGGKTYEGIDPIVVNNTEDKISANHVPLGVQDPLYFVQDDEEGCIIGFSGQTIPEGVMSESALGFENNKITGYNGSAFSAGNEYEAGSYVDITDNTISVTGLQPEGDYAYNSALSSKLDVTATGQFLTGLPEDLVYSADITGLATTAQLDEKLDKSDSANFYPMNSNPSGYLTGLPSDLATTGWVDSQGYLTAVDITESATWNATTQTVSANSAAWAGGTANPRIPVTSTSGISIFESGDKVYFNISADYAFTGDLTGKQDSLTFGYKDTAISSIDNSAVYDNSAHARITTLAGRISDLSSNKLDTTAFSDVSGSFLTAHQDISDLMPKSESANFYPMTGNPSGFINELPEEEEVEFEEIDLAAYQPSGDYYSASNPSGFISEVPAGTMNESAFSYDASDNITAYNGSAFAGGSDVPEGVMVESGLEYNAVNEISGYNGSAIAQYGAEKQWLQHDDTLVHAANSAQYALGVNLSAVARLLGIDETVLWSGSQTLNNEITLSESRHNFNSLKMWYSPSNGEDGNVGVMEIPMMGANSGTQFNLASNVSFSTGTAAGFNIHWTYYVSASDTTMKLLNAFWWGKQNAGGLDGATGTWGQGTNQQCPRVYKIIGIGRKQ